MRQIGPIPDAVVSKYVGLAQQVGEFLVVTLVLYLLGRFVAEPVIRVALSRSGLDDTVTQGIDKVVHVAVVVVALIAGAGSAGFQNVLGGSAVVVAAGTLAVGFAAQDVLSNFVSGIFIVQDPKLNVGDQIRWGDNEGTIQEIGFRVTRIRTPNNDSVVVPNTDLATSAVTNYTVNDPIGIAYEVGIGYGDDVDAARSVILEVADDHPLILDDPDPTVRVRELEDSSVVLRARFFVNRGDRDRRSDVRSDFVQGVHEACNDVGIDLSTTTQHHLTGSIEVENDGRSVGDGRNRGGVS